MNKEAVEQQAEEVKEEKAKAKNAATLVKEAGLDIGTSYVVLSFQRDGKIVQNTIRSAFLQLEPNPRTKKMLSNLKHAYIDTGNKLFLVGEPAIDLANIFSEEVKRPMSKGVLSPSEKEAIEVMRLLLKEVTKGVAGEGTRLVYSSPADPADGSFSTIYHQNLMKEILETDIGVEAGPMNEAHALGYSELGDDGYTGLCFSFGAGMVNAVLSYAGIDALKFSISKGGDWIDANAATSRGVTASQMQATKEQGIDLIQPKSPDEQALAIYYRTLITEAVQEFNKRFMDATDKPQINGAIPIVVAGGTSLAGGFIDLFKAVVEEKGFAFEVKEIRHAEDPLKAVSEGLLLAAME